MIFKGTRKILNQSQETKSITTIKDDDEEEEEEEDNNTFDKSIEDGRTQGEEEDINTGFFRIDWPPVCVVEETFED